MKMQSKPLCNGTKPTDYLTSTQIAKANAIWNDYYKKTLALINFLKDKVSAFNVIYQIDTLWEGKSREKFYSYKDELVNNLNRELLKYNNNILNDNVTANSLSAEYYEIRNTWNTHCDDNNVRHVCGGRIL